MDIYLLDDQMRRVDVFDTYKTFIWTERWIPPHEFELETVNDHRATEAFFNGRYLWIQGSEHVMVVETTTVIHDEDERLLRVMGRSVEKWMEDRIAASTFGPTEDGGGNEVIWKLTATPTQAIRDIVRKGLTLQAGDTNSHINTVVDTDFGSIPVPAAAEFQVRPSPVLPMINDISSVYNLGWGIFRLGDVPGMEFRVSTGDDRTTGQTTLPPVVFGEELGNLSNIGTLQSIKEYKNVAYVFSKKASVVVYGDNVDSNITDDERRVLFVDANDTDDTIPAGAELTALLTRRGLDELAKHKPILAFDGEADQSSGYVYGEDYKLGDRVEFRDSYGNRNIMVVSEQIFVVDSEGFKSYPTLSFYEMTVAGSWDAYNVTQTWHDVPDDFDHEWADLP